MAAVLIAHGTNSQWKSGLCDCCSTPGCCSACCCPCSIFGHLAAAMKPEEMFCGGNYCGGCCLFYSLHLISQLIDALFAPLGTIIFPTSTIVHCPARGAIRKKFNIPGSECEDCMIVWCCNCCALAQVKLIMFICSIVWK